ncbi:TetR family transcriptional regulator [Pantoea wallisii]|uniref:TetR family transcriptional regulator n=1 Tax=Pantoea wallisii TaxID=1076551 RepID=A0A1X1CZS3_9GAMM|nr:TetR family transcriptional regulator [Pantoea wallisii]
MTTKTSRTPGRPRQFDPDQAVGIAQKIFHSKSYDVVSVGDLTKAFGINPPSFYAAFGSKLGLYRLVLDRYAHDGAIDIQSLLRKDRPVAQCLADVLEEAAKRYAADPAASGCLVLEGIHCDDDNAREAASRFHSAAEKKIQAYIAEDYPEEAARLTEYVITMMCGLSARSRQGATRDALLETARLAAQGLVQLLPPETGHGPVT